MGKIKIIKGVFDTKLELKSLLFMVVATIVAACGGQKSPQDGGHGIGIDSATVAQIDAEDTDYVPQRSDYSFRSEVRVVNEDDEVEIIRYKWKDGKLAESEREQMSASDLTDD